MLEHQKITEKLVRGQIMKSHLITCKAYIIISRRQREATKGFCFVVLSKWSNMIRLEFG